MVVGLANSSKEQETEDADHKLILVLGTSSAKAIVVILDGRTADEKKIEQEKSLSMNITKFGNLIKLVLTMVASISQQTVLGPKYSAAWRSRGWAAQ